MHKWAITDHLVQENHVINWAESKIRECESDWQTRTIKDAVTIRKKQKVINRNEEAFKFSHAYNSLLQP